MARQKNIRHRALEPDSFVPLPPNEQVIELYNSYWKKFGIPADLRIAPLKNKEHIIVITDATLMEVEKRNGKVVLENGQPIPVQRGSNGFYIDDPDLEPTLSVIEAVLEAGIREGHGIALPMDEMYDRRNDTDDRRTRTVLHLENLTENQRRAVEENGLEDLVGQPLTLKQFEQIYGPVQDKEFYCFPEHSTEGRVKLLPKFLDAVKNQAKRSTTGRGQAPYKVIPFQKDGLYPLVPPDERGQGSNHWDRIFETWYAGRQGEEGRRNRKVFVLGACIDYSVALTAQWLKDTGYDVTVFAPGVKGLGITPKSAMLRNLAVQYAINVVWDWPAEFGEAPSNWDSILQKVKDSDKAVFEYSGPIGEGKGVGSWKAYVESVEQYQAE